VGEEADSSLFAALACRNDKDFWARSLVGMTRILFVRGSWVQDCDCEQSQSPHFSQKQGEVGHPQDKRAASNLFYVAIV
jgi:hypothetical protein